MTKSKSTEKQPEVKAFRDLGLNEEVCQRLDEMGWDKPTPIQAAAIPKIIEGRDLIGVAQTGTGKTGAFLLPLLQRINTTSRDHHIQALVITPTRELAQQIGKVLDQLLAGSHLRHAVVYGGVPAGPQRLAIKKGVDIMVATPGRLLDLMQGVLLLWRDLRFFTLDEADRMLDMGFMPDIEQIMKRLPMSRQTLLFTATMPAEIRNLGRDHMLEPLEIDVGINRSLAEGITEWVYPIREDQKLDLLMDLMDELEIQSGIIFCRTKLNTDRVGHALARHDYDVGVMHADRPQIEREKTLQRFRDGDLPIIVATDVASRGLDVTGITHVINYDVPQSPDDYVHRAGRTARAEAKGDAITFVSPEEERLLQGVEKLLQRKLERSVLAGFPYKGDPLKQQSAPRSGGRPSGGNRRGGGGGGRGRGGGHSRNR